MLYQMMVILRLDKIGGWIIDFGGKYFLEISEFIKPLDDKFEPWFNFELLEINRFYYDETFIFLWRQTHNQAISWSLANQYFNQEIKEYFLFWSLKYDFESMKEMNLFIYVHSPKHYQTA